MTDLQQLMELVDEIKDNEEIEEGVILRMYDKLKEMHEKKTNFYSVTYLYPMLSYEEDENNLQMMKTTQIVKMCNEKYQDIKKDIVDNKFSKRWVDIFHYSPIGKILSCFNNDGDNDNTFISNMDCIILDITKE